MTRSRNTFAIAALILAAAPVAAQTAQTAAADTDVSGELQPINAVGGTPVSGSASIVSEDGTLTLTLEAEGLSPGMHLAHVHGFAEPDPGQSRCPGDDADANGDGFVDLIETREAAGVTIIPFSAEPASLNIQTDTYPAADGSGQLSYRQSVGLSSLSAAVESQFGTPLALSRRVVFVHSVPEGTELPGTVQSLEGVPAHVTLPVACAELD